SANICDANAATTRFRISTGRRTLPARFAKPKPTFNPLWCPAQSRCSAPTRRRAPRRVLLADSARAQKWHVAAAQHQVPIQPRQPVALQKPGVVALCGGVDEGDGRSRFARVIEFAEQQ